MPKSLSQIESQIAKLERQRDAMRAKEVTAVVARIRQAIDYYGLTAQDLGFDGSSTRRRGNSTKKVTPGATKKATRDATNGSKRVRPTVGRIRYRDESGNQWTGHGKRPQWFKDAIASGKKPEDLAV